MIEVYIHQSSIVDEGAKIGKGTKIWHFSHIMSNTKIGYNCILGQNVYVGEGVVIGDNVKIQNNVSIYKGAIIKDDVFIGPSVVFTNVINPRSYIERKNEFKKTIIEKGASIGANSTIVCGHIIGKYSFVGAGTIVTKDILDYALCYGNPFKQKGWICECGNKLNRMIKRKWYCKKCYKKYKYNRSILYRLD